MFKTKKLLLLVSVILLLPGAYAQDKGTINWNDSALDWNSYHAGLQVLKDSGNKGILIIYADWCPTCKQYSKLFKNRSVVKALQGITLIRVNMDKQPEISEEYDLDGEYVPRTFALDENGNIIRSLNSNNPKFQHYLPANDPNAIIQFVQQVKEYGSSTILMDIK